MQALELKYGIYDEHTKTWLLCEFSEEQHKDAETFCNAMNYQHNKAIGRTKKPKKGQPPPELIRRYVVKAKGGD